MIDSLPHSPDAPFAPHRLHPAWLRGGVALIAGAGVLLWLNAMRRHVAEPAHTVEQSDGDFEIRMYAPCIVAETSVRGTREEASSEGFRRIAGYIFGGNQGARKIAMTAPVSQRPTGARIAMTAPVTQRADGVQWSVAFTMPAEYTLDTLPLPNDSRVTLRAVPAHRVAVLRFAGSCDDATVRARTQVLTRWASGRGLPIAGDAELNRYDPPWTLPFLRRNEVWLPLGG